MASEDKLNVISETIFKIRGISLTSYLLNQGCMSVTKKIHRHEVNGQLCWQLSNHKLSVS